MQVSKTCASVPCMPMVCVCQAGLRGADPAEWDEAVVTLGVEHVARLLTPHLRLAVSAAEPLSSKRNNALDRQVAKAAAKAAAMLDLPATNSSVSQGPTLDTCELRFVV